MFIHSNRQIEQVESGEVDDELIILGLEVSGDVNRVTTASFGSNTNFPLRRTVLNGGSSHIVLMPDSGLGRLYDHPHLTVHHDPEGIAQCLLDANYLPDQVFGRGADAGLRARLFDTLDMTDRGIGGNNDYRAVLRDIAGYESEETETDTTDKTEVDRLKNEYKYTQMKSLASQHGIDNANIKKDELAEWLASQDLDDV